MKKKWSIIKKIFLIIFCLIIIFIIWGYTQYGIYLKVPETRLALDSYYPEMPPDFNHIYIRMPIDHNNPETGEYSGFYLLSPGFKKKADIIFYLTDGQQNKVSTICDFKIFEEKIPGMSYVVMGRRGSYPALFPEVYKPDGSLDFDKSLSLYGTEQQIEDIEMVRKDLEKKGYLPEDGKIMLFATSGGGILIQEYLSKYGNHVSRALLEATGAPDIRINDKTIEIGSTFTDIMKEENPETLKKLDKILSKGKVNKANLCFMLYKIQLFDINWKTTSEKLINNIYNGNKFPYYRKLLNPQYNFTIIKFLMTLPMMDSTKVRAFEILGKQIINHVDKPENLNIPFEWEKILIKDYLDKTRSGSIEIPEIDLSTKRKDFSGQVLILSADLDNQFPVKAAEIIKESYRNSRMLIVHDTHAMLNNIENYQKLRNIFFQKGLNSPEFNDIVNQETKNGIIIPR